MMEVVVAVFYDGGGGDCCYGSGVLVLGVVSWAMVGIVMLLLLG